MAATVLNLQNNMAAERIDNTDQPARHIRHNISYRIKSPDEILAYLAKLHTKHLLLTVYIEGSTIVYASVILEINKDQRYLVLDELHPRNNISSTLLDQKLTIETQLEGILLQFPCVIDAISEKNGIEYYKLNFPGFIFYHQRREDYRVPISITKPLPVDLATEDDTTLHAELRDLSLGGFCAKVTSPMANKLNIGDEIPTCIIKVPGGKQIVSSLEIVRKEETRPMKNIRIGARFTQISKADRVELSKVIARLERENIKAIKFNDD